LITTYTLTPTPDANRRDVFYPPRYPKLYRPALAYFRHLLLARRVRGYGPGGARSDTAFLNYKIRETDMKIPSGINRDRFHIRAIRDEIGERLRPILKAPSQLSLRLLTLMKRLTKADR
jgi:hypothetical protein